ncbi:MAG: histidine kinase, partial [Lewinella sp.]|nr:histidine kinase [Lewinella sp.]
PARRGGHDMVRPATLRLGLLLLLCLASGWLPGQALAFQCHEEDERQSLREPQCMIETSEGFLLLGDEQGLWRYDGERYTAILPVDSLRGVRVTALYEDQAGRLWIGYANGAIYRAETGRAPAPWEPEEGWPAAPITGFAEDAEGQLWWATYGEGVYCQRGRYVYQFSTDDGLAARDIYAICADTAGRVLVATDNGVSHLYWDGDTKGIRNLGLADGLPDHIIRVLEPDEKGGCWVGGYEGGVGYVHLGEGTVRTVAAPWPGGVVTDLALFPGRDLWVATERAGLLRWDLRQARWDTTMATGWQDTYIRHLSVDAEGNLWVMSRERGICNANRRFAYLPLTIPSPQAVAADASGGIWIGTEQGLYYRPAGQRDFRPAAIHPGLNIVSLFCDETGRLWIGSFGQGLWVYEPTSGRSRRFGDAEGLDNGNILSIAGQDGDLWLATLGGAYHLHYDDPFSVSDTDVAHLEGEQLLGATFIYCTLLDREGRVWFGADGKGLSVLDQQERIRNFTHRADGSELRSIYSVAEDGAGVIWVSTEDGDLLQLRDSLLYPAPFLPSIRRGQFVSLATDPNGNLLIIHANGVDIWYPRPRRIVHYDGAVGLRDFEPGLNAVATTPTGEILVGGLHQLLMYTPLAADYRLGPRTVLTSVSVYLEPVNYRERSVYQASENNLLFQFSGLWYTDPAAVRYRYQLEGFDHGWIETEDQQAVYSNLPPGDYTFRVATTAHASFFEAREVSYTFKVLKPLWRRGWFILLSIALVAGWLTTWLLLRERRLQREAALKKEKIESQYEALKSQINPHFLFNSFNTLVSLIEEQPGQAVAYVEKLADFYRGILQYREKDLVGLGEEMEMVRDYAFLLQQRFGDSFRLETGMAENGYSVVPFAVQMLVENAVKHNIISSRQPLCVQVWVDPETNYLWVENAKQLKMTKERSTGFGIQSIRYRYGLLTSRPILVEDQPETFRVGLPLIANVFS